MEILAHDSQDETGDRDSAVIKNAMSLYNKYFGIAVCNDTGKIPKVLLESGFSPDGLKTEMSNGKLGYGAGNEALLIGYVSERLNISPEFFASVLDSDENLDL